jgi:hypothetical protein
LVGVTLPREFAPSKKVTLPEADPPYAGCMFAVKVTDWEYGEGFWLEVTVVEVDAGDMF